jgi:hypothetical protein
MDWIECGGKSVNKTDCCTENLMKFFCHYMAICIGLTQIN